MNKKYAVAMAVLTLSAIMMAVILLVAPGREAQASMLNAQTGYSMMTAGAQGGDEALIIVDKSTQKMVIYRLQGNTLELVSAFNFGGK